MMLQPTIPVPPEPIPEELRKPILDVKAKYRQHREPLVTALPSPTSLPPPTSLAPPTSPLQDLSSLSQLFITKRLRVRNVLSLRGKKNKFYVRTPDESLVYTIDEENRWWVGYLFYGLRPLELKVSNNAGEEVMRIVRPWACTVRVLPCQLQRLQVFAPPGQLIGTVEQQWTPVKPLYLVKNKDGDVAFLLHGPVVTLSCFNDIQFYMTRPGSDLRVGGCWRRWRGIMFEIFVAAVSNKFGVSFDTDLNVDEKGLLLASGLLMQYMYLDS